jgi:hypothetical protein
VQVSHPEVQDQVFAELQETGLAATGELLQCTSILNDAELQHNMCCSPFAAVPLGTLQLKSSLKV